MVSRLLIKRSIYSSFVETVDYLTTSCTAVSMVLDWDLALWWLVFFWYFFPRLWIGTVRRQTGIYYAVYSRTWISVAMVKAVVKIFIRYSLHQYICLLILIVKNLWWDFIQVKHKGRLEAVASNEPIFWLNGLSTACTFCQSSEWYLI